MALVLLLSVFRARVAATLQVVIDDAKRVFAETAGAVDLREPSSRRILLLILMIGFAVRLSVLDRPMGFRETQYTKRVSCPYVDCRRVFFPEHKLVPATCRPFKPPTSEQIVPIAEPLESDS